MSGPREGSEPIRVLHVIAPARYGGAEAVIRILVRAQREAGLLVQVAAVVDPGEATGHPFVESLRSDGGEVAVIPVTARGYRVERRLVRERCLAFAPSILHAHGARAVFVDGGIGRRLGAKLVSTVHGMTGGTLRHRTYERLMLAALRRYDAVAAVSRPIGEVLERHGVAAAKVRVIPNAFPAELALLPRAEARAALGLQMDGFVVGWLGRLVPEKGGDVLVRALAHLEGSDWQAVLIGHGPEGDSIRAIAEAGGFAGRLAMPGSLPSASQYLGALDVFVLSSRTEGTPVALLEAMAARVPIVATAVGGVPDVVGPEHALLVPPDRPVELARAIDQVRRDPAASRARAAAAARRLTEQYGVDAACAAYSRMYRDVLEAGSPADGSPAARSRGG